jgi:hypothetical protein
MLRAAVDIGRASKLGITHRNVGDAQKLRFGVTRPRHRNRVNGTLTHSVKTNHRIFVILLRAGARGCNFRKTTGMGHRKIKASREISIYLFMGCFTKRTQLF